MTQHVTLIKKDEPIYSELQSIKGIKKIPHNKGEEVQVGSSHRMLTVIKIKAINRRITRVYVKCECGNYGYMPLYLFRIHNLRSCGCQLRTTESHGLSRTRIYRIWLGMNNRCLVPSCNVYHRYGKKGIGICEEWRRNTPNAFMNFYEWAIKNGYNDSLTIDRINPTQNYEPQNCRWATYNQQNAHLLKKKITASGYRGIKERKGATKTSYYAVITINNKQIHIGTYSNKKEAVEARNQYIIANQLNYPIQEWIGDAGYAQKGE